MAININQSFFIGDMFDFRRIDDLFLHKMSNKRDCRSHFYSTSLFFKFNRKLVSKYVSNRKYFEKTYEKTYFYMSSSYTFINIKEKNVQISNFQI